MEMGWLCLVILIIASFAMPRLGISLLAIVIVCVLLLGGLVFYFSSQKQNVGNAQPRIKYYIPARELYLSDVKLTPQTYSKNSFQLTGRVRNNDTALSLTEFALKLILQDCPSYSDGRGCETVGETTINIYISVPALQSRDFDEAVTFYNFSGFKGSPKWQFSIADVNGDSFAAIDTDQVKEVK